MSVHSQVVEIIFNDNFNARIIVMELAKQHPTIFLKLCGVKPEKSLDQKLKDEYNAGAGERFVEAVRLYRQLTGAGLKEAVDYVKALFGRV